MITINVGFSNYIFLYGFIHLIIVNNVFLELIFDGWSLGYLSLNLSKLGFEADLRKDGIHLQICQIPHTHYKLYPSYNANIGQLQPLFLA
jgi:hypothetical protein